MNNGSSLAVGSTGLVSASQWSTGSAIGVIVSERASLTVTPGGRITTWESGNGESIGLVTELDGEASFEGTLEVE